MKQSQQSLRIQAAEKAMDRQERDENNENNATPRKHLEKVRGIRERELGKQNAGMGGTSDVMKKVR